MKQGEAISSTSDGASTHQHLADGVESAVDLNEARPRLYFEDVPAAIITSLLSI
jgi:hypothetical protein